MNIEQAEVWLVEFSPQRGSEIAKRRPAIVVSHNSVGRLPLKTIVPITDWKERYNGYPWMLPLDSNASNGLTKRSAIDCFQIKNLSDERFVRKLGKIEAELLRKIHQTIAKTLNPVYALQ
ncbi:type II toxin-antitoxin system PemK/MazF family toxin [Nitratifractor sp.]|uniref:type II toxin-antitoxin system PemK/MazF family toxin n=1 Tax=Nitratifractor sp. TaxID=2268144 RepID=UPI0025FDB161|nr:type II toxin-antitoxin system PemK/MazF family toxin [Nitratifractor sp.]